jgi:simple sugar transport system ATP-binding protein
MAGNGVGIIMISDEIPEVINNCSRIAVMRNGRIVEEMDAGNVTEADVERSVKRSRLYGREQRMMGKA